MLGQHGKVVCRQGLDASLGQAGIAVPLSDHTAMILATNFSSLANG
jgi:hypothetical protein